MSLTISFKIFLFPAKVVKVDYYVEPHGNPVNPVSVSIPVGGSALQLMEAAANKYGTEFYFTAKYYGKWSGFEIEKINSIPDDESYYWEFLVKTLDGSIEHPDVGVSAYCFAKPGYGMIMRLKKLEK